MLLVKEGMWQLQLYKYTFILSLKFLACCLEVSHKISLMLQKAIPRQLIALRGFLYLTYYFLTFFFEVLIVIIKTFLLENLKTKKDSSSQYHNMDEDELSLTSISKPHLTFMLNLVTSTKSLSFSHDERGKKPLLLSDKLPT